MSDKKKPSHLSGKLTLQNIGDISLDKRKLSDIGSDKFDATFKPKFNSSNGFQNKATTNNNEAIQKKMDLLRAANVSTGPKNEEKPIEIKAIEPQVKISEVEKNLSSTFTSDVTKTPDVVSEITAQIKEPVKQTVQEKKPSEQILSFSELKKLQAINNAKNPQPQANNANTQATESKQNEPEKKNNNFNNRNFNKPGDRGNGFQNNQNRPNNGQNNNQYNRPNNFNNNRNGGFQNGQNRGFQNKFQNNNNGQPQNHTDKYAIKTTVNAIASDFDADKEFDMANDIGDIRIKLSAPPRHPQRRFFNNNRQNVPQQTFARPRGHFKKHKAQNKGSKNIEISDAGVTIEELADVMSMKMQDLERILKRSGVHFDSESHILDADSAQLIAEEAGFEVEIVCDNEETIFLRELEASQEDERERAPIVTVMGHVDHGKTSLLDTIRNSSVADKEAGGITQHIGGYQVNINGRKITFLDTPGHAAFSAMRARGATLTDIIILVVAADDGIMPQTIEAINHAKSAGVPVIVAVNKIDQPGANVDNVKHALLSHDLVPEEFGGDTMVVPVSAKKNTNIDKLLEAVLLQADVMNLSAFYSGTVEATVVESKISKQSGVEVSAIIRNGTLKQGLSIIAGKSFGKVRAMFDENAKKMNEAEPSVPVMIYGFDSAPKVGDTIYASDDYDTLNTLLKYRQAQKEIEVVTDVKVNPFAALMESKKVVSFLIKADTLGSLEVIKNIITQIKHQELDIRVANSSNIGSISNADIDSAKMSKSVILGFNVSTINSNVTEYAKQNKVDIHMYNIIYNMIDDVKKILSSFLTPDAKEIVDGHAEVRAMFELSKAMVVGSYMKDGTVTRTSLVRVIRGRDIILSTKVTSLRRNKDDVKEVGSGYECGINLEKSEGIKAGDILEFYHIEYKTRTID